MSFRWLHGVVLLGIFASAGCKEEDGEAIDRQGVTAQVVTAICGPFTACDCEDSSSIEQNEDCDDATSPIVQAAVANAADLALRWHPECLSKFNAYAKLLACDSSDEVDPDALAQSLFELERCKLVAGTGGRGEPCQTIGGAALDFGDTCTHDLACDGTLCRPYPSKRGDWCGGLFGCPAGLRCLDPEGDGLLTCIDPALEGDKCNPHDAGPCAEDLYCDLEKFECDELPGEGDPCLGGMCQEGLACPVDVCVELPGVGEACPDFICDPQEATCNAMMECEALPGEDESCLGACAAGLQCGPEGVCVELPAAICSVVEGVGLCLYQGDGICDEPEGTDLCPEGTDPSDCIGNTTDPTDPSFTTTDPSFTTTDPTITATDATLSATSDASLTATDPTLTSSDSVTLSGGTFGTGDATAGTTG